MSKLKQLRTQSGLTQAQLAVFIGVTTNTIQNWEADGAGIQKAVVLLKLCVVLGCELTDLVDEEAHASVGMFSVKQWTTQPDEARRSVERSWRQHNVLAMWKIAKDL